MKKFAFPIAIVAIVAVLVGIFVVGNKNNSPGSNNSPAKHWADNLPGLQTSKAPWPANNDATNLQARLNAINLPLPSGGMEGTALHIHQHLDIYINGQHVDIPPDVGIGPKDSFFADIHVHPMTPTNIIHVESPVVQDFFLGQVFAVWGVDFGPATLGGYHADAAHPLKIYANGKLQSGDPRDIKLASHQEIAIVYGTSPKTIPSSFKFTSGL